MPRSRGSAQKHALEILHGALKHIENNPTDERTIRFLAQFADEYLDIIAGRKPAMARKTYTIDLKIDFEDESRHQQALEMMRASARKILTQAHMIADSRPPQVALRSNDFFEGTEQLKLMPDESED